MKKKKIKLDGWIEYKFAGYIIDASCDLQLEGCIAKEEQNKKMERFRLYNINKKQ